MDQRPKKKQHIVSKGQFIQAQCRRIGFGMGGYGLLLLAILCGFFAFSGMFFLFAPPIIIRWVSIPMILLFATAAILLGKWGIKSIDRADSIDPGIPLTRKVAENLPSEESLVRASEEPTQPQQAVLLRATIHDPTTPSEQLVRPAGELEP